MTVNWAGWTNVLVKLNSEITAMFVPMLQAVAAFRQENYERSCAYSSEPVSVQARRGGGGGVGGFERPPPPHGPLTIVIPPHTHTPPHPTRSPFGPPTNYPSWKAGYGPGVRLRLIENQVEIGNYELTRCKLGPMGCLFVYHQSSLRWEQNWELGTVSQGFLLQVPELWEIC